MHLADITPSIFASLGLAGTDNRLEIIESPAGRELLFLIDGLGADVLEKYRDLIPTISSLTLVGVLRTSFPSTTATSLATLMTGELPGTHGMLGYTVRVPRSGGRILNSLKWDERVDPIIWQPVPTIFERARDSAISVTHVAAKRYETTGFTQAVFRGATYSGANVPADLIEKTVAALKERPSFVYLYVNDLDSAGHCDGVGSDKWLAALVSIDSFLSSLVMRLPRGTRIWLTADHGMINVAEKVILGADNNLLDGISTVAGEPRARHLYLEDSADSPSARLEVADKWREFFGERATIFTREEAIASQVFGAAVSADASDRMGDLIAVAHGGLVLLDPDRAEKEGAMVGHHGGLSDIESTVALLTRTYL
ncbi:MAG: alkaline phosphatase family protein [Candidatus Planktophila sp.]